MTSPQILHGDEFYSLVFPFWRYQRYPKPIQICAVQHSETTVDVDHVDQVSQAPFVDLVCKPWTHNLERLVQRWIDETPLATRLIRGVCLGGFTGKSWTRDTWEDTVEEESVFHSVL